MKKSNDAVEGEWHYRKINPTGPGYAADRLEGGSKVFWDTQDPLTLVDINGNTVGEAEFTDEEDE